MNNYLVLADFEGTFGSRRFVFKAGDVRTLSAAEYTALQTAGLLAVLYVAATHATLRTRFNEQYGDKKPERGMAEMFLAAGLLPPPLAGAGSPVGTVTGLHGQTYRDTTSGSWYICSSSPSGTTWVVV